MIVICWLGKRHQTVVQLGDVAIADLPNDALRLSNVADSPAIAHSTIYTIILHSPADDVVPFADSEELIKNSGLPESALIEIGTDYRLADPKPLGKMLDACEWLTRR